MEKINNNKLKNNISSKVYKVKMSSAMPSNNNQKELTPAVTGINSIEKLKKQLQDVKQNRVTKAIKPAVRIQEIKNRLIILAHDLLVNKKLMIVYIEKYNY